MSRRADELTFTLAYGDCDTVGIAYFAMYYPWMERCSTLWWHAQGIRIGHLAEDHGVVTVALSSSVDYLAPIRVFDTVTVRIELEHLGTSSYRLGYAFLREVEEVARGRMTFACRDLSWARAPLPPPLRGPLEGLRAGQNPDPTSQETDHASH